MRYWLLLVYFYLDNILSKSLLTIIINLIPIVIIWIFKMKWLIGAAILVAVGVFLYFAFNNKIYRQEQVPQRMNTTISPTNAAETFKVTPISHATMVLTLGGRTIYTDPVGGGKVFSGQREPDLILITDIHSDHLDSPTLKEIVKEKTVIVVPQAVADKIPELQKQLVVIKNGEKTNQMGIDIEAIPMYNLPESNDAAHTKGRGNGYVVTADNKRIYIAGDTDGTPEMRALKNIDVAFVPMNPPYTMDVEEAADAVVAFKPKVVHPYHYRGPNGLSDINKFKELVESKDPNINVELLNFYPSN